MAREERFQNRIERQARALERVGRKAMAKEDKANRKGMKATMKASLQEQHAQKMAARCLHMWRRLKARNMQRAAATERHTMASKRLLSRVERTQFKHVQAQQKSQKKEMWRKMNRADITMGEILAGFKS